ncbi:MAG: TonB-dependent receptor [Agarilytica sp.]
MASHSKKSIVFLCLALLVFLSTAVLAADGSHRDDFYDLSLSQLSKVEITTATGNSTPLDRAPATATVITAQDISAMGARSLDEVLETVPGLHVSLSSLSRLDSVYSIRGIHTGFNPHVLLLMNGVPVQFSVQGGRPVLFRYPAINIERIEVIRGPGSAIYGADAYSGVINVITKDSSTMDLLDIGGRSGSFGNRELWLSTKKEWREWLLGVQLSYQRGNGDSGRLVSADLQSGLDAALLTEASLAPGSLSTRYEVSNIHIDLNHRNWSVGFWNWRSSDSGLGAGAAQALDNTGGDENDLYQMEVAYKDTDTFENWSHQIRSSLLHYETQATLNLLPAGTIVPIGSDGNVNFVMPAGAVLFSEGLIGRPGGTTEDRLLDITSIYTGFDRHRWRFSFGTRYQELDSREEKNFGPGVIDGTEGLVDGTLTNVSDSPFVFVKDTSRTTNYLTVQNEWRFAADWDLTAGVRYDRYSDFGSATNFRAALVWAARDSITAKLLYGGAFRAPSFSEQFNANNPVSLGNSDLDPEEIDTFEFVVNVEVTSALYTALSIYQYSAKDMIEFLPDAGETTNTARNARDQNGKGFEFELNWDISPDVRIKSSYSWSRPEDEETGRVVADAPGKQTTVNLNWDIVDEISFNVLLNRVEDRARAIGDERSSIDDYTLLDLTFRYDHGTSGLGLVVAMRNAFDKDAKEPSNGVIAEDYLLEGRSAWLELHYSFN